MGARVMQIFFQESELSTQQDRCIVLGDTEAGNQSQLCFILSKGCLESEDFFKQLLRGGQAKSVLPVAACKDFEFPDDFELQCAADAYDDSDAALPILQALQDHRGGGEFPR